MAAKQEAQFSDGLDGGSSDRGTFDDQDQLVKLGKKPVLKVRNSYSNHAKVATDSARV